MRASLVSRELIADSIELMDVAHDFDALVCIVGCDKTVPAALMALARIDKPAVVIYSGPMRAGHWHGEPATIQDVWEAVGAARQGSLPRAELDDARAQRLPRARHLRRALHGEHDGAGARVPRARRRLAARWSRPTSSSGGPPRPRPPGGSSSRLAGGPTARAFLDRAARC